MSSETISLKKVFEKIERLERERDLYKSALEVTSERIHKIVDDIIHDMADRRGFRYLWSNLDNEIRNEIRQNWVEIIKEHLSADETLTKGAKIAGGKWQDADIPDEEFERLLNTRKLDERNKPDFEMIAAGIFLNEEDMVPVMTNALEQAYNAGRDQGLDEAADECIHLSEKWKYYLQANEYALAIKALKGKV